MSSSSLENRGGHPELRSLYEISLLLPHTGLQDYFRGAMTTLSRFFPVGYAALLLRDAKQGSLRVEALYGIEMEDHPQQGDGEKGIIGEALQSRSPRTIHHLHQEPFYEELLKKPQGMEKIRPPLLSIPLVADSESIGVLNITPLHIFGSDFTQDFDFLSVLCAILSSAIKTYHLRKEETSVGMKQSKWKSSLLEEILEERLTEVLNKLDPYVESKSKTGLLSDIVSLVEKILIKSAMQKVGNVQTSAAQLLGINRNTLRTKLKAYKIKFR